MGEFQHKEGLIGKFKFVYLRHTCLPVREQYLHEHYELLDLTLLVEVFPPA